ncbi:SRPBCC family protein [Streptomyces dioscori]|uniref:SRPBCC family protein n=1 Tax=Streptomyces dioscori TaxID=2109333 RepID=A0A2P8Q9J0_9ACTN|nr:SRPBCC family protein [Streptomyces dioscori]PSM42922.1 SRPBCC family protein [Streptomyces dioscori]
MHDAAHRQPDIHWPSGFSPAEAHRFHRAHAVVHGPPERSFTILTDVANLRSWVPECEGVSAETSTGTFDIHWSGHRFEVFRGEYVPPSRIGWMAIGGGVQLYQAWLLTEHEDGTDVVVESIVRAELPRTLDTLSLEWAERLADLWRAQHAKLSEFSVALPRVTDRL